MICPVIVDSLSVTLPRQWMWENYSEILAEGTVFRSLFNSVFVAVITVVIVLATASLLSYAIVRRGTKGCLRI